MLVACTPDAMELGSVDRLTAQREYELSRGRKIRHTFVKEESGANLGFTNLLVSRAERVLRFGHWLCLFHNVSRTIVL